MRLTTSSPSSGHFSNTCQDCDSLEMFGAFFDIATVATCWPTCLLEHALHDASHCLTQGLALATLVCLRDHSPRLSEAFIEIMKEQSLQLKHGHHGIANEAMRFVRIRFCQGTTMALESAPSCTKLQRVSSWRKSKKLGTVSCWCEDNPSELLEPPSIPWQSFCRNRQGYHQCLLILWRGECLAQNVFWSKQECY